MQACLADPEKPDCTEVDRARGFVVIKDDDPAKPKAWLIVPDREVTGIESPAVFRPPVADFWRYGWDAGAALLPDEPVADRALAINSKAGRSQDLLHIHISCVLPEVARRARRRRHRPRLGGAAVPALRRPCLQRPQGRRARPQPLPAAGASSPAPAPTWPPSRSR